MLQPGIFLMHHPSAKPAQAASEMMATQQPAPGSACATEISDRVQMATVQRFVSVDVLVTEIQKQLHLPAHGGRRQGGVERICSTEQDVLTLHAHYRAQRPIMGLWEFCTWLRVLIGADMLMATVQGLSGQVAGASPTRGKPYCGTCL